MPVSTGRHISSTLDLLMQTFSRGAALPVPGVLLHLFRVKHLRVTGADKRQKPAADGRT